MGSHFSAKVIEACKINDILFICLPPNSTHLCQPLDVAIFKALKVEWKDILDTWCHKSKSNANLPKTVFPGFIYFKFLKTVYFCNFTPHPNPPHPTPPHLPSKSILSFEQSCDELKMQWDHSFPNSLIFIFLSFEGYSTFLTYSYGYTY